MTENISQQVKKLAANLETSVGELVKPKSTTKRLFGTGKDRGRCTKSEVKDANMVVIQVEWLPWAVKNPYGRV
jgi:hypothetical protein